MTLTEASSTNTSESQAGVTGRVVDGNVIWLEGEYDLATVSALSETIARAMESGGGELVIDLSGVQFIDATTIGVIIKARNDLDRQQRSLALRAPSKFARRVLELCDLAALLDPPSSSSSSAGPFPVEADSPPVGGVGGALTPDPPSAPGE
jgi:anti-sigma B factor antagonist